MMDRNSIQDLSWTITEQYEKKKFSEFGLCGSCREFRYRSTKLMEEVVWCDSYCNDTNHLNVKPNKIDPIFDCSDYYPKGQLSLSDMSRIAVLIDVNEKKSAGFKTTEKEVKFSFPEDEKND